MINAEVILEESAKSLKALEKEAAELSLAVRNLLDGGHTDQRSSELYLLAGKIYAQATRYRALMDVYVRHGNPLN